MSPESTRDHRELGPPLAAQGSRFQSVRESAVSLRRGAGPCGRVRQGCWVLDSNIEQNTEAEQVNKRRAEWLMWTAWGQRAGLRLNAPPACNTSACASLLSCRGPFCLSTSFVGTREKARYFYKGECSAKLLHGGFVYFSLPNTWEMWKVFLEDFDGQVQ